MKSIPISFSNLQEVCWSNFSLSNIQQSSVTIWKVATKNLSAKEAAIYQSILCAEERSRMIKYISSQSRNEFLITRAVLRLLLAEYLKKSTTDITISTKKGNSKPFIHPTENTKNIHFNVSHSGNWSLIIIGNTPLGIDVEKINPGFGYKEIMDYSFTKEEKDFIKASENKQVSFYTLWSRKESLLKGIGTGLATNLNLFSCLTGVQNIDESIMGISTIRNVRSFFVDESHIGAVAAPSSIDAEKLKFYEYKKL